MQSLPMVTEPHPNACQRVSDVAMASKSGASDQGVSSGR